MSVAYQGKQKDCHISAGVARDIHKVLRTAFNQAKRWKYIQQNTFVDADVPDHKSKEPQTLYPEEFEKILEYTDDSSDYERYTIYVASVSSINAQHAAVKLAGSSGLTTIPKKKR